MKLRLLPVFFTSFLISCNTHIDNAEVLKKTKSGFEYKIIPAVSGDSIQYRDIVKLHLYQYIDDSLLGSTAGKMPQYITVNNELKEFDYTELLQQMRVGDSAVCLFSTADIIKRAKEGVPIPPYLQKGKYIKVYFKIAAKFSEDAEAMFDAEKARNSLIGYSGEDPQMGYARAERVFDSLIKSLPVQPVKLPEGVYVQIKEKGSGPKITKGQEVAVVFKGMLTDGRVFEVKPKEDPLVVHAGMGEAMKGLDAALTTMAIGDKAILYVPAVLAYGSRQAGEYIPAFSNLIFEMEATAPVTTKK